MLHLVCATGRLPGYAETDYPVWTKVTLDQHQSCLFSVSNKKERRGEELCVCGYLEDSSDDEHRLVCDLRVLAPTVQPVSELPAGFCSSRTPEDASGVWPLQVQKCQHVLWGNIETEGYQLVQFNNNVI